MARDFVSYSTVPDRDELESDECQYAGCEKYATHVTGFRKPSEYVAFCRNHAMTARNEPGGKSVRSL